MHSMGYIGNSTILEVTQRVTRSSGRPTSKAQGVQVFLIELIEAGLFRPVSWGYSLFIVIEFDHATERNTGESKCLGRGGFIQ